MFPRLIEVQIIDLIAQPFPESPRNELLQSNTAGWKSEAAADWTDAARRYSHLTIPSRKEKEQKLSSNYKLMKIRQIKSRLPEINAGSLAGKEIY